MTKKERASSAQRVPAKRIKAPEVEAYDKVVETASLRELKLVSSSFDVKPEAHSENFPTWRPTYDCTLSSNYFVEELGLIFGSVKAEVRCKHGRASILTLKSQYVILYKVDGKPEEAAALKFMQRVARFSVYPYFRAHFAELCSQAGLNVPPLPILREGPRDIAKTVAAART